MEDFYETEAEFLMKFDSLLCEYMLKTNNPECIFRISLGRLVDMAHQASVLCGEENIIRKDLKDMIDEFIEIARKMNSDN